MAKLFTEEFNSFEQINSTQAWSLFFSISDNDSILGANPAVGRYITVALFSGIIAGILEVAIHII